MNGFISIDWEGFEYGLMVIIALLCLQTCSESITSVQGGVVASAGYDEIVCSTYAGKNLFVK